MESGKSETVLVYVGILRNITRVNPSFPKEKLPEVDSGVQNDIALRANNKGIFLLCKIMINGENIFI